MAGITSILAQHLTRYDIEGRLGVGGMASVYKATDTRLKRKVAIKVMHEHLVQDSTFQQRFETEAQLVASFNHPNIIQIYDYNVIMSEGHALYYMVMPYISGPTLADLLEDCRTHGKALTHQRISEIITDIAAALDYAHQRETTHRDVKPANIIFDENGTAILTDFGIARLAQGQGFTQDGAIVGTPTYLSPEQAQGQSGDHRSDLYALGILLYEMLTGHPPFHDESVVHLLLSHAQTPPPSISEALSKSMPALDYVLEVALAKNPAERYQTGTDFVAELEAVLRDEATSERLEPMPIKQSAVPPASTSILELVDTGLIQPVRRYPLVAGSVVVTVVAFLLIARLSLPNMTLISNSPTPMAASSMVDDIFYFDSHFANDDNFVSLWQLDDNDRVQREVINQQLRITNSEASTAINTLLDPAYIYENAVIEMDVALLPESADAASGFGIVFRYQDPANYNVFAVDGEGRYSIWTREDAEWRELRAADENWTLDSAINPIGEVNSLRLSIWNETLIGYVNDEVVVMIEDDTFFAGGVGVYLATTRRGEAMITVDRFAVAAAEPVTESMTADQ